jgi:FkbM family methyltransferase
MINPGPYLRSKLPGFYYLLISFLNTARKILTPYSIYITDSLGGSFKEYMSVNNMPVKISELKKDLDDTSCSTIDIVIERFIHYPDERHKRRIQKNHAIAGGLLRVETDKEKKKIDSELKKVKSKYPFLSEHVEESVFFFHHGLRLLPRTVHEYIKASDFIDAGAFIGDSAIALSEYGYNKIWSIEMSLKSITRYRNNIAKAGIGQEKYEIINAGLASSDSEPPVNLADTGSAGFSLIRRKGKYDEITVNCRSLDSLTEEYSISPRFIKADIEGYGMDFVKGAIKTLVNNRPVISIAIYHNPFEFFEIKPFLDEHLENYNFFVRKLSSSVARNECHSEIVLLGYPREISPSVI